MIRRKYELKTKEDREKLLECFYPLNPRLEEALDRTFLEAEEVGVIYRWILDKTVAPHEVFVVYTYRGSVFCLVDDLVRYQDLSEFSDRIRRIFPLEREAPECTNQFLEPDGFCTACGKHHWREEFDKDRAEVKVEHHQAFNEELWLDQLAEGPEDELPTAIPGGISKRGWVRSL